MRRGRDATQELTVDEGTTVTFDVDTRNRVPRNPRQEIGGTSGTLAPFIQQVDWWRITPFA